MIHGQARIGTATVDADAIVAAYGITDRKITWAVQEILCCGWGNPAAARHVRQAIMILETWGGLDSQPADVDPYLIQIGGIRADTYRVAIAFGLDPVVYQALKKLLRAGRKHKSIGADVAEAITSLIRWEEIQAEDAAA